jgi:hypothetical protein
MKKTFILFFFVLFNVSFAQNLSETFQITPYASIHGFSWKEFSSTGAEDLKEAGPRFSFGVVPRFSFLQRNTMFTELSINYTFGTVDYDGFLMDQLGNRTPYTNKTAYSSFEIAADAGYIFELSKSLQLAPVAGFGFEYWNRDLDNGGPRGYDEKYSVFLANVGVRGTYILTRNFQFFSGFLLEIPLSISESVNLAARGQGGPADISLNPGINPRYIIEVGGSVYRIVVVMYFETWTLSESGIDKGFRQPESTRKLFGLRIGYSIGLQ